jgi:hypothetical protein
MRTPPFSCAPIAFLALFIAGCGSDDKLARYKVSGSVKFQGQPVEKGEITFEDPAAGQVNSSPLGSGGSYSLELPAGSFKVNVAPPRIMTKGTGDSPPDEIPDPAVKNIPKKYWTQEKSGLSADVAKDKRTFDFELKP